MDSDIKIFAPDAPGNAAGEDLESLAAQTEALRESGILDRAKRLGRELAGYCAQSPELLALAQSFGFALAPQREQQLHVLMVFSSQYALRVVLQPKLLAEASITAMNNYLINHAKAFWDTISDGSAFTQYLLAAQAPSARAAMGEAFAHICGQEDNPDLRALGATVFHTAVELVQAKWEEATAP